MSTATAAAARTAAPTTPTGRTIPWSQVGRRIHEAGSAAEAIAQAGLDWTTSLHEMALAGHPDRLIPRVRAVLRDDNRTILGTVGEGYKPISNQESFDFLDGAIGSGIQFETAGIIGGGAKIWMLARAKDSARIGGKDDTVDQYILLTNDHVGKGSLTAMFTPMRVWCSNMLARAKASATMSVRIQHSGDTASKVEAAQRVLGLAHEHFDDFARHAQALADAPVNAVGLEAFLRNLIPSPKDPETQVRAENTAQAVRTRLTELFEAGQGNNLPGTRGTLWAAYNAVTEYVDWEAPTRAKAIDAQRAARLESAWFGAGQRLKANAFELAFAQATRN